MEKPINRIDITIIGFIKMDMLRYDILAWVA